MSIPYLTLCLYQEQDADGTHLNFTSVSKSLGEECGCAEAFRPGSASFLKFEATPRVSMCLRVICYNQKVKILLPKQVIDDICSSRQF